MTAPPPRVDVGELRHRLRTRREGLDASSQREHATAAAARFAGVAEVKAARTFGVYLADDGELDPGPLVETLAAGSAVIHLPVVERDDMLRFRSWDPGVPLIEGRWGIPVPPESNQTRSTDELDVVVAPLVAVDRHGTRIGRGVGYYDRALSHRLQRVGRPMIIGYGHHFQLVDDALPRHRWDVPLDLLVTEEQVLRWTDGEQLRSGSEAERP